MSPGKIPAKKESKSEKLKGGLSYSLGVVLVGCSIADAALNPFAFITADKLLFAGLALMGADRVREALK